MEKKGETRLSLEYSKKTCDQLPDLIDRYDVRKLVINAFLAGYRKGKQLELSSKNELIKK